MKKDNRNEIRSSAHSKYRCLYHIVFAPKYRRKEIHGKLRKDIGEILRKLCEQKGAEIIAVSAGHIHWDTVDTGTLACPLLTVMEAGAPVNKEALGAGEQAPVRTKGTDTETSFYAVTINKAERKTHLTRVGAGNDRTVAY